MKKVIFIAFVISIAAASEVLDYGLYTTDSELYIAKNDIVAIHSSGVHLHIVFIVEREITNGIFKGLYGLETDDKDDTVVSTKVLDNGKCIASDNTTVYFGASDGIYTYNFVTNKAEKYGNITADVTAIQKDTNKDVIYAIIDKQLNKITNNGTKISKVDSVKNVQEMVLDKDNNIYFYEINDSNSKLFKEKYSKPKVIVNDDVINIQGLPDEYNQMKLTRSVADTEGVILLLDKQIYRIFPNGTSMNTEYVFDNVPTAFYLDLGFILLFGHDRKLYQFNAIGLVLRGIRSAIGDFYGSFLGY